ncbi:HERC2 [Symbiodinium necroappetens]|uniref:HERC2 protein n=1 Tax=Symbiodinium necroappetens TaxID=1628268 RepID=A0A813AST0_9DINO|nr:HERC2 [Symbiodinium necroappetens]
MQEAEDALAPLLRCLAGMLLQLAVSKPRAAQLFAGRLHQADPFRKHGCSVACFQGLLCVVVGVDRKLEYYAEHGLVDHGNVAVWEHAGKALQASFMSDDEEARLFQIQERIPLWVSECLPMVSRPSSAIVPFAPALEVEEGSMRKSASHGGLPRDPKRDPKQRRALLRHIDCIKAGFPEIVCFEQTGQRLRAEDRHAQLSSALQKGDAESVQKLCAVALSDPALQGTELVCSCKKLLRHLLHFRKLLKDGRSFLQGIPWDYPAEQVDINLGLLRNSQWGPGVWDEDLVAKAKIMKDADLLKLLRSVRPLNDDGSLKTRVDLHRCVRAWLTLTEAGVLSEHLSRMILLRLCECGKAGVALGLALAEPWFLLQYHGTTQMAFVMEELWKHLWKGAQLNKTSELKVVPILPGRASGLGDLSGYVRAQQRELLLKGPPGVLSTARRILDSEVGAAAEPGPRDAEAARLATVLCVIPTPALLILGHQGLFPTVLQHCAEAPLAAALQVCAAAVGLTLTWSPKRSESEALPEPAESAESAESEPRVEESPKGSPRGSKGSAKSADAFADALGASLLAAAEQLQRIGYPKEARNQEQAGMKMILSACAKDIEDKKQLTIEVSYPDELSKDLLHSDRDAGGRVLKRQMQHALLAGNAVSATSEVLWQPFLHRGRVQIQELTGALESVPEAGDARPMYQKSPPVPVLWHISPENFQRRVSRLDTRQLVLALRYAAADGAGLLAGGSSRDPAAQRALTSATGQLPRRHRSRSRAQQFVGALLEELVERVPSLRPAQACSAVKSIASLKALAGAPLASSVLEALASGPLAGWKIATTLRPCDVALLLQGWSQLAEEGSGAPLEAARHLLRHGAAPRLLALSSCALQEAGAPPPTLGSMCAGAAQLAIWQRSEGEAMAVSTRRCAEAQLQELRGFVGPSPSSHKQPDIASGSGADAVKVLRTAAGAVEANEKEAEGVELSDGVTTGEAHGLDELLPDLVRQLAAAEPSDPYQWGPDVSCLCSL